MRLGKSDPPNPTRFRRRYLPPVPRLLARLILFAPMVVYVVMAAGGIVSLGRLLNARLAIIVEATLKQQLGHEFRIGRIDYSHPGMIEVDNVAVSSKRTFATDGVMPGLTAKRVRIRYDAAGLLADPQNAVHYISHIDVDTPVVLIERYTRARFDFTDLIRSPSKKIKPFSAVITATGGRVYYRDYTAPRTAGAVDTNAVYGVRGTVDCTSPHTVSFEGGGTGRGRFGSVSATGDFARGYLRCRISGNVVNGDAGYWVRFLHLIPLANVFAGRADARFCLLFPGTGRRFAPGPRPANLYPIDVFGSVVVRGAGVQWMDRSILRAPVKDIYGFAEFASHLEKHSTRTAVAGHGVFTLNGQPLAASGSASIAAGGSVFISENGSPSLAQRGSSVRVRLDASNVDPRHIADAFERFTLPPGVTTGLASGNLVLSGPFSHIAGAGTVRVAHIAYGGNVADGVGNVDFSNRLVGIHNAVLTLRGGGLAHVDAAIDATGAHPTCTASGIFRDVNVARLNMSGGAAATAASGTAEGAFIAVDNGSGLVTTSNITIHNASMNGLRADLVRGRMVLRANQSVTLDRVAIEDRAGRASVSGTIGLTGRSPSLRLFVDASDVDIASLAPREDAGGKAYFDGYVRGTAASPHVAGEVHVFRAHYRNFNADVVHGYLTAVRDTIYLAGLHIHRFPADIGVTGSITHITGGNPALKLRAVVADMQLDDLKALASSVRPPLTGINALHDVSAEIGGDVKISGTLRAPILHGPIRLDDVVWIDNHIDTATGLLDSSVDDVSLSGVKVTSGDAQVGGSVDWRPRTGRIDGTFRGTHIELYRFRHYISGMVALQGNIDVNNGMVGGTVQSPAIRFSVVGRDISVDGQPLDTVTASVAYENGVLENRNGPWAFSILEPMPVGGGSAAGTRRITYSVDQFQLTLPTTEHPSPLISATLSVPPGEPEHLTHLVDTVRQSRLAGLPSVRRALAAIDRLPRPFEATLSVPRVTLTGSVFAPTIDGEVDITDAVLGQNQIGMASVVVHAGPDTLPEGLMSSPVTDATIQDSGMPPGRPAESVTADIHVADILAYGSHISNLTVTGGYDSGSGAITVSDLEAVDGDAYFSASGTATVDGTIDATVDASEIPLSAFDWWMTGGRRLTGRVASFTAEVTGRMQSPDILASVDVIDPAVVAGAARPIAVVNELRSGTIHVQATPDGSQVLTVNGLTAFHGSDPVATLTGSIPFPWGADGHTAPRLPSNEPLHAELDINALSVLAQLLPAIDPHRTGGSMVATLDANGPQSPGKIVGHVDVHNAMFGAVGLGTALDHIHASIDFDQSHVAIESLSGESTAGGDFTLSGSASFELPPAVDLVVHLDNFTVKETGQDSMYVQHLKSSARGKISGDVYISRSLRSPLIATRQEPLHVTDAAIGIPAPQSGPSPTKTVLPVDPVFRIATQFGGHGKSATFFNALLRADMSGQMLLTGTASAPAVEAQDLAVDGGQLVLPGAVLRLDSGGTVGLKYTAPNPGAEPVLTESIDVYAETSIMASPADIPQSSAIGSELAEGQAAIVSPSTQQQQYKITVHAYTVPGSGDMKLDPTSVPALDRTQIEGLLLQQQTLTGILTGSGTSDALTQEFSRAVNSVGLPLALSPIETDVQKALGLSAFTVNYSPDQQAVVNLSVPLGKSGFEATFLRALGSRSQEAVSSDVYAPQYQLELSYNLTHRLRISVSTDDQQNNAVSLEGVLGF
ncbi:MAG: translocation/assembly module TamB domain-containing protein [Capsulimonadaceae bacterium]